MASLDERDKGLFGRTYAFRLSIVSARLWNSKNDTSETSQAATICMVLNWSLMIVLPGARALYYFSVTDETNSRTLSQNYAIWQ